MKKLNLLYIDTPFIGFDSGDKNRSKFLYDVLKSEYISDLLLVQDREYSKETILSHNFGNKIFTIKTKKQKWYKANAIFDYDDICLEKLKHIIIKNHYDVCFIRMASHSKLADVIKKISPNIKIVIDVDMLFSQISSASWNQNKTLKNRYHFFESKKLSYFEKKLFNKNYNFLYTNKNELNLVQEKYNLQNEENHFVLPNVINKIVSNNKKINNQKYILFYGVLNSMANISAYNFLVEKIYPLLKDFLIENKIKIYIVGKNSTKVHEKTYENIELIGEVDDISWYIKNSLLVLFPLTIASGTLTRILEVAYLKKSIVSTRRAANGLDLEGKIFISDDEKEMINDIKNICTNLKLKDKYERLAYEFVKQNYSFKILKQKIFSIIDEVNKKTNVLHIPRRFTKSHWGGTENVVLSIANGLKNYGVRSKIITSNILCDEKEELINNIKVKRFNYFYPYFNLSNDSKKSLDLIGGNLFSWSMLKYLFFIKDVDLIHLHTAKRMGSIARTICKIRNIPYIITIHGGLYDISETENSNRMKPTEKSFEWGKVLGFLFGSRKVYNDANSIITLNQKEYESTKENYPNKKVYLLENSVNIKQFQINKDMTFRKRRNIPQDKFVFLTSARIDRQKNQLLVLEVLKAIVKNHNKVHLLLVGNVTDEAYYQELKVFISKNHLEQHVTILTNLKQNSDELINCYLNSNAFILPSRHEPFGIVALEAWASNLPLIVSDICGICNVIEDKKNALIFQDNKKESLFHIMKKLLDDNKLREKISNNGSKKVLEFDENIINNKLFNIYEQTINFKNKI